MIAEASTTGRTGERNRHSTSFPRSRQADIRRKASITPDLASAGPKTTVPKRFPPIQTSTLPNGSQASIGPRRSEVSRESLNDRIAPVVQTAYYFERSGRETLSFWVFRGLIGDFPLVGGDLDSTG